MFNFAVSSDARERYYFASMLFCSNQLLTFILEITFYAFNFMLAYDMANTVKNPFAKI